MELVLWNLFAISFICLIASYYKLNKREFNIKKKLNTNIIEVKPNIVKNNNNILIKNSILIKKSNLQNALKYVYILFNKKPHSGVVNFITNLNLTQYFINKNTLYFNNNIHNNFTDNILKNREIIINNNGKNVVLGKNFIYNNCAYFYKVFNNLYITSKTIINPINNVIITEVIINNLSNKKVNFNLIQNLNLSQVSYQTKYDKSNQETTYIHNNNFIINKTIGNIKFQKFYSRVLENNRKEIELNNFDLDGKEKIKTYFISAINVNLQTKITKQNIDTNFIINFKEYTSYIKNLSLLTKGRIEHVIKKSNLYYANLLPYKNKLKNNSFYIQPISDNIYLNKKLYIENANNENLQEVRSLFLLINYPVEIVLCKTLKIEEFTGNCSVLHNTGKDDVINALNINKPNYLLRRENEYNNTKFAIKLNNYFKNNISEKWFSVVSFEEKNAKIKNLKTNETTFLISKNLDKINTNIFFKVNTKIEYINNLINKFLPQKVYKEFIKSNDSDLYKMMQKPNIKFLKHYHYNYVIKLLIQSKQYVMLYKYLVNYVLGIQVIGNVIKMNKQYSNIGKFEMYVNGEHFTKFNNIKDYYFVYNNIIYHNVNLLKLNNEHNIKQLEILK